MRRHDPLDRLLRSLAPAALLLGLALTLLGCGGGGGPSALAVPDMDHDGIPDAIDNDLDGDGRLNQYDDDVDGDGLLNAEDEDADDDGRRNALDPTPYGPWIPAAQTLFVTQGVATVGFGDVPAGQLGGPAIVTIQNDTPGPVGIASVELSGSGGGAFAIVDGSLRTTPFTLGAGGSASFEVTFTPHAGVPALGRVVVRFDIDGSPFTGIVHLLGQGGSPALLASGAPSTINFGDVPVGVTAGPGVARLRNDTSGPWTLAAVELTGTGGDTFALDLSPLPGPVPFALEPGQEVRFHVTYTPKLGVSNVGEVTVTLAGAGGTPRDLALDLLGQGVAGAMTVTPTAVAFDTALAGVEVRETQVEIRNQFYASGDLTLSDIALSDDGAGAFELRDVPALPLRLAPGDAPAVVTVRFAPGASQLGAVTGTLHLVSDDPLLPVDVSVAIQGTAAGWQAPSTALPADVTAASPSAPTWLAGSSRFVLRSAGPNGVWGGLLGSDDEIVVVDADPDGDPDTADARVIVRWGGLRLSPVPSCAPVDAGTGRHVFFLSAGLDGSLGTGDDQVNVLDTVSGSLRSRQCPSAGAHKSLPVIVDANRSLVVVATGVDGGLLASADTLLVYGNLLGDLDAVTPDQTLSLGVVVPDLACCVPVALGTDAVALPAADASDDPDLSDRALDDGNEGVVFVRALGTAGATARVALERALAVEAAPAPGAGFCRPVALGADGVLVMTAGVLPGDATDDELVRIADADTAAPQVAEAVPAPYADGVASRPVPVDAGLFAYASPGADLAYGTGDDALMRVTTDGGLALAGFGPGAALAGGGGAATRLAVHGGAVLVASAGADGIVGSGDDAVLHLDVQVSGAASVLGAVPVPGGLFQGDRSTSASLAGPTPFGGRFLAVLDRGADGLEGTADDVLRLARDRDGDGVLGAASDDLDGDGAYAAADTVRLPVGAAHAATSSLAATTAGHLLVLETGADAVFGGGDDRPVLWWLREATSLP